MKVLLKENSGSFLLGKTPASHFSFTNTIPVCISGEILQSLPSHWKPFFDFVDF